jgi:hypothetical protein
VQEKRKLVLNKETLVELSSVELVAILYRDDYGSAGLAHFDNRIALQQKAPIPSVRNGVYFSCFLNRLWVGPYGKQELPEPAGD